MFDFVQQTVQCPEDVPARRVLSVSGGGLLGVIPAAMLMRYEALGRAAYGDAYRLSDSFDLVGGSSTGAVIATGVALGLTAREIADFYLRDVPRGFRRRRFAVPGLHDMMDGDLLQTFFNRRTEGRTLHSGDLRTGLCITVKDLTQGRTLAFTNAPSAPDTVPSAALRSDDLPLDLLLRASTAAPGLFPPVPLRLGEAGTSLCIDGGFGPHNHPGHLLYHVARAGGTCPVELTALGTGASRPRQTAAKIAGTPALMRLLKASIGLIKECEDMAAAALDTLSHLPEARLSSRTHDMALDRATFEGLGIDVSSRQLRAMRSFANPEGKERLFEAATRYAALTIDAPLPLARQGTGQNRVDTLPRSGPTECHGWYFMV